MHPAVCDPVRQCGTVARRSCCQQGVLTSRLREAVCAFVSLLVVGEGTDVSLTRRLASTG